ncbi:MAG: hypothetical protein WD604_14190 [Balneolaceae bacterium]
MKTKLKTILLLTAGSLFLATDAWSQVGLSAEVMSRYVWRGADFGNSPSIQPDINYTSGNFELGTWAAFATNGNPAGTEVDFYSSYTFVTEGGDFQISLTDYTFPQAPSGNYFQSSSHFLEAGAGYSGTETFPVNIFTGVFLTNDDDYSVYTQIGYEVNDVELFLGFTPAESALYGTTSAGVINTGIAVGKDLPVTDLFSLNLSGAVIANPYSDDLYFLFGIGF